jgi:hypothetical protein
MTKAAKGAVLGLGLAAVAAIASPRDASALHIWTKFDVPGYASGDTAYLCSDGSQFYSQAIGYNNNGASICFQQAYQTGSWQLDTGWCAGTTSVKGLLRAGAPKWGPVYCTSAAGGWNQIVSCNANMTLRQNSPTASCAFKTATGNGYLGD